MTHFQIRKAFLDFFKERGHKILPGSSLIPQNDPSLLFVNAGMNQFKSVILGLEKPPAKNVVTIQKCMRAGGKHNDLENVGQTSRHNTFFEMMGNFSFGGYFKQKAIALAWELFTEKLKMNPDHLWVSVYKEDEESYTIWRDERRIPENKIYRLGEEDNFWKMGDTGPCGPCTEIHYYRGKEKRPDPDQLMEFGNLVFMEFDDKGKGQREKLSVPCVDTGMGLERICAILQNKQSIYHTDCFKGIIQSLEEPSGCKYDFTEESQSEKQMAFRVLADHSRAAAFLINDGVLPGNEGQSYVLRRILRRAFFYSDRLNIKQNLLSIASQKVVDLMGEIYPALRDADVEYIIQSEAELFMESLKSGKSALLKKIKDSSDKTISNQIVWTLYSTYGFPPDLTRLIAKEKGFEVDETFDLEKFKEKAKKLFLRSVEKDLLGDFNKQYHPQKTEITDRENSKITHLIEKPLGEPERNNNTLSAFHTFPRPVSFIKKGQEGWLLTDKTCFYPEGGGPIGDRGTLETETGWAEVRDCQRKGDCIFHEVKVMEGELKEGQQCKMKVDEKHRRLIAAGHSATHLLHQALREELGSSVQQKGSLVKPGWLRFDFSHQKPLTENQISKIEKQVRKNIQSKHSVSDTECSYEEAVQSGALFLRGENYTSPVRVISMGNSREFCGGIHVKNTSDIGCFKIISETGVQSGVRRITAYVSEEADKWLDSLAHQNFQIRKYLQNLSGSRSEQKKSNKETGAEAPRKDSSKPRTDRYKSPTFSGIQSDQFGESAPSGERADEDLFPLPREGVNPFIFWIKTRDEEIKRLKNQLKNFIPSEKQRGDGLKTYQSERILPPLFEEEGYDKWIKRNPKYRDLLAEQILELKKYLKFPALKDKESLPAKEEGESPFISLMESKREEIQSLKSQLKRLPWERFSAEKLREQAKPFQNKGAQGSLLVMALPATDRKVLADMADQLKLKISSGVVALLGTERDSRSPLAVVVTKDLQKHISAGELMKKTIIPLLGGKGGGQTRFAQGAITHRENFPKLEKALLQALNSAHSVKKI